MRSRVGDALASVGRAVDWIAHRLAGALAVGSALSICVVALAVSADVMRRQLIGPAIPGVVQVSVVLLVVMVFFGVAQSLRTGQEISVDILVVRLTGRARTLVEVVALVVSVVVVFPMLNATWDNALASFARGEYRYGLVQVPVWPARFAIPIGLASYLLLAVVLLARRVRLLVTGAPEPERPQEEETAEGRTSVGGM